MLRFLGPLIIILVAVGGFLRFTQPLFADIRLIEAEKQTLNQALDNAKKLREAQDRLLAEFRAIPEDDLNRLNKLLPDNVDNVRLIIDINNIAKPYGMNIRNIQIKTEEGKTEESVITAGSDKHGSVTFGFSVTGSYENFKAFLNDLAQSLRLIDLTASGFSSAEKDVYDYTVEIQTYWLK